VVVSFGSAGHGRRQARALRGEAAGRGHDRSSGSRTASPPRVGSPAAGTSSAARASAGRGHDRGSSSSTASPPRAPACLARRTGVGVGGATTAGAVSVGFDSSMDELTSGRFVVYLDKLTSGQR
jgi:hypothetical protein